MPADSPGKFLLLMVAPAHADFEQCKDRLKAAVKAEGIDVPTVVRVMDAVPYNARVIELDNYQYCPGDSKYRLN